jgi:hypothetical protein
LEDLLQGVTKMKITQHFFYTLREGVISVYSY